MSEQKAKKENYGEGTVALQLLLFLVSFIFVFFVLFWLSWIKAAMSHPWIMSAKKPDAESWTYLSYIVV